MITCDFSQKGKLSLCEYLENTIRDKILSGELKADEKLPSKRELAEHLGVSVITVQNAYANLISEGYIYSIEKRGFFVTALPEQKSDSKKLFLNDKQKELKEHNSKIEILCDLTSNSVNYETFPFSTWNKISRKVLNSPQAELLKRQNVQGAEVLRSSIAEHLRNFRGFDIDPKQIVVGAGTEILYSYITKLLGNKTIFAVENPGYKKISLILEMNGAKVKPVNIDENGIIISELNKSKANAVHVTPNHHFPSGIVMPVKRRIELLSWADKNENRYIIEDDFDSEFRFQGKPVSPLFCRAAKQNVIYINTFSKTLSPSFRISYMVLPEKLIKDFYSLLGFYSCTVSTFEQYTLSAFIKEGHFSKHISRMKNYYRNIRNDLIYKIEHSPLKEKTEILEKDSGLHFLLKVNTKLNDKKLKEALLKKGSSVSILSDYYFNSDNLNSDDKKTLVINYSGLSKQQILSTVNLLSEALGS